MPNKRAIFQYGEPQMIDYTPAAAVLGGDVIVDNEIPLCFHRPYDPADGSRPAAPQAGVRGGIYAVDKNGSGGPTFNFGDTVYFNPATGATTATTDDAFGMCVKLAGPSDTSVLCEHNPHFGTAAS